MRDQPVVGFTYAGLWPKTVLLDLECAISHIVGFTYAVLRPKTVLFDLECAISP
jgi:hypothetical protein